MMNQTIVETDTISTSHPHISRHVSVLSVLVSLSVAVVGAVLMYFSLQMDDTTSTASIALLTLGIILFLFSLYRMFFMSMETIYIPTGSPVKEGSCYFDLVDMSRMLKLLDDVDHSETYSIGMKHSGNGRLDYKVTKDKRFVAVQLFRFIPYTYEPASDIYYYTDHKAASLIQFLKNNQE